MAAVVAYVVDEAFTFSNRVVTGSFRLVTYADLAAEACLTFRVSGAASAGPALTTSILPHAIRLARLASRRKSLMCRIVFPKKVWTKLCVGRLLLEGDRQINRV